jgi:type II secretory pathway pseudopilin PulG
MNADLQRFVREALGRGLPRAAIREQLLHAGWRTDEVEAALRAYVETDFPLPVPRRRPYLNAREAFLYLVLFATLYTSAFNTGQVLFCLIERWLPDALQGPYEWGRFSEWIRGSTAGIIIAFPIFLVLSRVIGREVAREPEKRGSPIRKWLTYLTLLIAALVMIGDLTVLVTRVLGGELPPRFLLKALVVFLIAATVFGHYLADLRREEQEAGAPVAATGLVARVAAVTVFVVMLSGLFFSGSPRQARWQQLDDQRVEALRTASSALQTYYNRRGVLPDSLEALLRLPDTFVPGGLRDPETNEPYGYERIDSLTYQLCARFRTADTLGASRRRNPAMAGSEFWEHGAGRKCFRLEVLRNRLIPSGR